MTFCFFKSGTCSLIAFTTSFFIASISGFGLDQFSELKAFSSENWSRPKPEIDAIKKLVVKAINEQVPDLKKQKVKLKFFGEIEDFGSKILSKIEEAEAATNEYESELNLNVALEQHLNSAQIHIR